MKKHLNYYFLGTASILLFLGILFLATLSAPASLQAFGNTNYYLFHQLIAVGIGLAAGIVVFKLPIHVIKKVTLPLFVLNLLLLIVVFLPKIGTQFWGAKRWISIGNNSFQPSEFLKITAIMYVSAWLSNAFSPNAKRGWIHSAKKGYDNFVHVFLPFLVVLGIIAVILFFQKDLSTLGIISIALITIYFIAGTPFWHTLLLFAGGILGAVVFVVIEPYRVQRFLTFLHPESDPLGVGFQLKQSLLALGSGGIFGKGIGMSTQKFGFLPQAMSDSIFAIIGEEVGIIGCTILITLFVILIWQIIRISNKSTDAFSRLTAIGIAFWIITQTFMNIASTVGLFPLSGIPLPFFSYGGSHIITEIISVGLLLNISKHG